MTMYASTYADACAIAQEWDAEGVRPLIVNCKTGYLVIEDDEA